MNTLIIDDSEIDRMNLRVLLEDHPKIQVLDEAANLDTARKLVKKHQPDLLFLDIHLGKEKGFHLLDSLEQIPHVIFTTAHPQYALKGFEVAALDYILKPVTEENLKRAISRLPEKTDEPVADAILTLESLILFSLKKEQHLHPVSDIVYIQTSRPYTEVKTQDGSEYLHNRTLREWDDLLPKENFLVLDRSCLVNLKAICRLTSENDNKQKLHFLSPEVAPVLIGPIATKKLLKALAN